MFSIQRLRGRPSTLSVPVCGVHCSQRCAVLPSAILFTCPFQRSSVCPIWSRILCTPNSFLISSFRNLSRLMTPLISLRTLISAACTLLVVADDNVHVSQPNKRMYVTTLADVGTYLSLSSGCSRLTFLLYWEIRSCIALSLSSSDELVKVTPRYLNDSACFDSCPSAKTCNTSDLHVVALEPSESLIHTTWYTIIMLIRFYQLFLNPVVTYV